MGVLEKNRPQVTSKSTGNVAVQKPTSQAKAPDKPKSNERTQEKSSAPKKSDDGGKKSKTASKTSATKVCAPLFWIKAIFRDGLIVKNYI